MENINIPLYLKYLFNQPDINTYEGDDYILFVDMSSVEVDKFSNIKIILGILFDVRYITSIIINSTWTSIYIEIGHQALLSGFTRPFGYDPEDKYHLIDIPVNLDTMKKFLIEIQRNNLLMTDTLGHKINFSSRQ